MYFSKYTKIRIDITSHIRMRKSWIRWNENFIDSNFLNYKKKSIHFLWLPEGITDFF